jgi:hypothetical protein
MPIVGLDDNGVVHGPPPTFERRLTMVITEQQRQQFEGLVHPLIEWLNNNCHPHVTVVVDSTSAELLEGLCSVKTTLYLRD